MVLTAAYSHVLASVILTRLCGHDAQGSCECFAAFGGPDCSACGEGYVQSGGTCSRYVRIRLPYIALQDHAASVNVRLTALPAYHRQVCVVSQL